MAYRFGHFQLDPRTGTLSGPQGTIPLRRQAFRLAEVLLEHAPELLEHNTLLDRVWGRTALSVNVLPQTISELRHALGDDAHHPRFIETVHRRGYRFVCPVDRIASLPPAGAMHGAHARALPNLPPNDPMETPQRSSLRGWVMSAIVLPAMALVVASSPPPSEGIDPAGQVPGHSLEEALSLTVLRMCAQLPAQPVKAYADNIPPFPATLVAHPLAVPSDHIAPCLPAR